jgi:hypothetical protein
LKKFLKRFTKDKSGLAYIWGIAACTICFFPLIYWVLSVLLDGVTSTMFDTMHFQFVGVTADAWLLVKTLISALPVIVLLITVLFAAVNAKSQSYEN